MRIRLTGRRQELEQQAETLERCERTLGEQAKTIHSDDPAGAAMMNGVLMAVGRAAKQTREMIGVSQQQLAMWALLALLVGSHVATWAFLGLLCAYLATL